MKDSEVAEGVNTDEASGSWELGFFMQSSSRSTSVPQSPSQGASRGAVPHALHRDNLDMCESRMISSTTYDGPKINQPSSQGALSDVLIQNWPRAEKG